MSKEEKSITEQVKEKVNEKPKKEIISWYDSGSTILNLVCGFGFPKGKIINIVGDKSSGKTLLALEFACIQKRRNKNIKVIYDDAEAGFNFDEEKLYGIKVYNPDYSHSETVEDLEYNIKRELKNLKGKEELIYIIDSLDAISSDAEKERSEKLYKAKDSGKTLDTGSYNMTKQKQLGITLRLLAKQMKNKNCTLIIISQVRYNIGVMFGEKYTVSGGKALEFYASIRLYLAECEKKTKKDIVTGITIKVKTKKNKVGMPFREGFVDVLFDYGLDNIMSNICYLYDLRDKRGKLKSKVVKLDWDRKDYSIRGLIKHIEDNNLERQLTRKVQKKWKEYEDSISSDRKRRY